MLMRFAFFVRKLPRYRIVEINNGMNYLKFAVQKVDDAGNWTFVGPKGEDLDDCRRWIKAALNGGFVRVVETYSV